jgi:hypothetical protein
MANKRLTIKQKKDIFAAIVELQDSRTVSNIEAIRQVGKLHDVEEPQIRQIIDEGIEKGWFDELVEKVA